MVVRSPFSVLFNIPNLGIPLAAKGRMDRKKIPFPMVGFSEFFRGKTFHFPPIERCVSAVWEINFA